MLIETWVCVEDQSIPHLTGSKVVIDQFGGVTHEPIEWEYLGDGKYRERSANTGLLETCKFYGGSYFISQA